MKPPTRPAVTWEELVNLLRPAFVSILGEDLTPVERRKVVDFLSDPETLSYTSLKLLPVFGFRDLYNMTLVYGAYSVSFDNPDLRARIVDL